MILVELASMGAQTRGLMVKITNNRPIGWRMALQSYFLSQNI